MSAPAVYARLARGGAISALRSGVVLVAAAVATGGAEQLAIVASSLVVLGAVADAWWIARQLEPLARHVARPVDDPADAPPSAAAVRDALAAPRRLGMGLVVLGGGATLACVAAELVAGRVVAAGVVGVLGGIAAAFAASAHAESTRATIGQTLLARVRATDVTPTATSSLVRSETLYGVLLGAAGTLAATAMLALRAHGNVALAGAPIALVGALCASLIGRRHARGEVDAIQAIATRAGTLRDRAGAPALVPSAAPDELRAAATALEALSRRLAEDDAHEAAEDSSQDSAQRMKTQFLAAMSHDLRSPLNSILGFSELLARGTDGPLGPAQLESVQAIRSSGAELLRLLTDIVDSARLEAGKLTLRRAWTPSVEILTEAVTQGRELVGERALRIEAELQPGLPPVYVDRQRVVQAVVGLFGHAAGAMQTGVIRLAARVASGPPGPERQVRVTVRDESRGVSPAQIARIFEAFRAISEPGGRRIGGLGLNLSLARALVRLHGGDIAVQSEPGVGTTFTIALPLDGPPSASE